MSWFTTYIEHPFINAFAQLQNAPAIVNNPAAAAAVADLKAQATSVATAVDNTAAATVSAASAVANPAVDALGSGIQAAVDAYLMAALGPIGAPAAQAANTIIALGENYAHTWVANLFSHASAQVVAAPTPKS